MKFKQAIQSIIEKEYQNFQQNIHEIDNTFIDQDEKECNNPSIILLPLSIQGTKNNNIYKCLLDSGSMHTLINRSTLPRGTIPLKNDKLIINTTIIGNYEIKDQVILKDIALPEFSKAIKIEKINAFIFNGDNKSPYDIILGRDFLKITGIDICFSTNNVKWFDMQIPMKPQDY